MTAITFLYGPSNNSDNYVLVKQMLAKLSFNRAITTD